MAKMMPHIIRQGEYLDKLAFLKGFDADEVWNAPDNADLRARRDNPNLLCPGDILYLPKPEPKSRPIRAGVTNSYVAEVPLVSVRVVLLEDGAPLADEVFAVDGLSTEQSGTTAADGSVTFEAPITAREVSIILPNRNLAYQVRIGDLDPSVEAAGVAMRLSHLGYYGWFPDLDESVDAEAHRRAIAQFQVDAGLPPTGEHAGETIDALIGKHGI
jgi:hypothetical protein